MRFGNAIARLSIMLLVTLVGLVETFTNSKLTEAARWRQGIGSSVAMLLIGVVLLWLMRKK